MNDRHLFEIEKMKKTFLRYLRHLLPVALVPLALVSCESADSVDTPEEEVSGRVSLSFNISPMRTRSDNPDNHPEEEGFGGELAIYDKEWLHVYIHDAETDRLIAHFNQSQTNSVNNMAILKNPDGTYYIKVSTHLMKPGARYRLSVMANCQDKTGDLYNLTPQFCNTSDNKTFLQTPHWMPFSGFRNFTLPEGLASGETYELGNLWLLRAVARIDINLASEMQDRWIIRKAVIEGGGTGLLSHGYPSPALAKVSEVNGTEQLTIAGMYNPCDVALMNDPAGDDLPLCNLEDKGTSFRIYLPEQPNPMPSSGKEIKIRLEMYQQQTGTAVNAWLYMRTNQEGEPFNLVRNHIYRFEVKTIKPLFDVDVDIVAPENRVIDVPSFN